MAIILLVVLLIALSLTALWYRSCYVRALEDQIALANFLMEVLTNDRERAHQQTDFLQFVMTSEFSNAGAMSEVSANRLIDIARKRAPLAVPANRKLYWAMNETPDLFFENCDPKRPR
jgi:hypothetical protein